MIEVTVVTRDSANQYPSPSTLGSGTANNTKVLYGDLVWRVPPTGEGGGGAPKESIIVLSQSETEVPV